jgi:hypothetical protein
VNKLKFLISIVFSTLILYNTLRVSITYIYYNLDTEGFIEALCENKDKPELKCNGKCHLKKITQSTNEEENKPKQIIDFNDLVFYNHKTTSHNLFKSYNKNKTTFQYLNLYRYSLLETCFHPPNA